MALRIQNNVEAFGAHRRLVDSSTRMAKSMERLSSGYRINRASDDAAGLGISEKMRAQLHGLHGPVVRPAHRDQGHDGGGKRRHLRDAKLRDRPHVCRADGGRALHRRATVRGV